MKKVIILLIGIFFLTGCSVGKIKNYKNISDIVTNTYNSKDNNKRLNENDQKILEQYLSEFTTNNPLIDLEVYIIREESYKTNEHNTEGVIIKDNKCYIHYDDIKFIKASDEISDDYSSIICEGYNAYIVKDQVINKYDVLENNKQNKYNYLGYIKGNDYYSFVYRAYNDGLGMVVKLSENNNKLTKIETSFENVNDYRLSKKNNESSNGGKIFVALIVLAGLVVIVILVYKKVKKNNTI